MCRTLVAACTAAAVLTALTTPASGVVAAPAAPSPLRLVSVSPRPGVYAVVPTVQLTFNQPVVAPSVRLATGVEAALGGLTLVRNPTITPGDSGDTLQVHMGTLWPGAYSLVVGPAVRTAGGTPLGKPAVFDFVYAPHSWPWEHVRTAAGAYTVWLVPAGAAESTGTCHPVADGFLATSAAGGSLPVMLDCPRGREQAVAAVYATTAAGALVTSATETQQLVVNAEMQGWIRYEPPAAPASLIAPGVAQWAQSNGPGSPLLAGLEALQVAGTGGTFQLPSRVEVYRTVLATGLSDGGAPGEWAAQRAADLGAIADTVEPVATGGDAVDLLDELSLAAGGLSLPGADVVSIEANVLKGLASNASLSATGLDDLASAEYAAATVQTAAPAFARIAAVTTDATLTSTIADLLRFNPAQVEGALAATYARVAVAQYGDVASQLAAQMVSDADPVAGAVLLGVKLGLFLADFTAWQVVGTGFYQAAYTDDAFDGVAAAASALRADVLAEPAPSQTLVDAAVLAQRLEWASASDFYTTAADVARSDAWAEAVDQDVAHLVQAGSARVASQDLPSWEAAAASDQAAAGQLLPGTGPGGLGTASPEAILARTAAFPRWPAPVRTITTCGVSLNAPGVYVLGDDPFTPNPGGREPGCEGGIPEVFGHAYDCAVIAAPGVVLDFAGHTYMSDGAPEERCVVLPPAGTGALVEDGTVAGEPAGPVDFNFGVDSAATGVYVRGVQFSGFGDAAVRIVRGDGDVVDGIDALAGNSGHFGVLVTDSADVQVVDSDFNPLYSESQAAVALVGSSDSQVSGNRIASVGVGLNRFAQGVYIGCAVPWSQPLPPCPVAAGDRVTVNEITMANPYSGTPAPRRYEWSGAWAIALNAGTRGAVVEGNVFRGQTQYEVVWDSAACGTNVWKGNAYDVKNVAVPQALSPGNRPCIG